MISTGTKRAKSGDCMNDVCTVPLGKAAPIGKPEGLGAEDQLINALYMAEATVWNPSNMIFLLRYLLPAFLLMQ